MAPNNPILDIECGITITLVYKGAKYKRCSDFFWGLAQHAWEPISPPQMGPGGRDGGWDGGMRLWWIYLESQVKRRSLHVGFIWGLRKYNIVKTVDSHVITCATVILMIYPHLSRVRTYIVFYAYTLIKFLFQEFNKSFFLKTYCWAATDPRRARSFNVIDI